MELYNGNPKYLVKILTSYQPKPHTECLGFEPGHRGKILETKCLSHGTASNRLKTHLTYINTPVIARYIHTHFRLQKPVM